MKAGAEAVTKAVAAAGTEAGRSSELVDRALHRTALAVALLYAADGKG
jgi:hypothetical protein